MSRRSHAVRSVIAGSALAAAMLASGAPAHAAYKSRQQAQPGFEQHRLAMTVRGKPRIGSIVTLTVTGFNQLYPETPDPDFPDRKPSNFTLEVFVQDRSVFSTCARSVNEQRDRIITLPDKVDQIAHMLDEGPEGTFRHVVKYRAGKPRRIMFCAYTRYQATDDIVRSSLKHDLRRRRR